MNKNEKAFMDYLVERMTQRMPPEETPEAFVARYDHICYCECIILLNGNIMEVRPSHTIMQTNLAKEYLNVQDEHEFPMYEYGEFLLYTTGAISVWYDFQERTANYAMSPQQQATLQLLSETKKIRHIAVHETFFRNVDGYVAADAYIG